MTPRIRQVVLDTTDARALAEFYRELFGLAYRPGDEPPPDPGGDTGSRGARPDVVRQAASAYAR